MKQILLLLAILLPVCASAQFEERFDDNEISPEWTGARERFIINENGQVQLNASPDKGGEASIQRRVKYAPTMQWELDVRLDHVPSDDNRIRIYLYNDANDVYRYVQIGYDGNKKIGFRSNGKDLFERKENSLADIPIQLHVKVTLEDNSLWTVYTRKADESLYQKEGEVTHPITSPLEEGWFNIDVYYTKTRSKSFYFDNIQISHQLTETPLKPEETPEDPNPDEPIPPITPEDPDNPPLPELLGIDPISPYELQYIFNDQININKATFSISGIGSADRVLYGNTKAVVNTHYPTPMKSGSDYTFSYSGVTDLSGRPLPAYQINATFEEEETPAPSGSVIINEVMADPNGVTDLPATEYIELHNTTETPQSLSGWSLLYGDRATLIGNVILPPMGYAVLYKAGRDINSGSGLAVPLAAFPAQLVNTGKQLQLLSPQGTPIDQYTYPKAWERGAEGWHLSSDPRGGTPGTANSSGNIDPDNPEEPSLPETPEEPEVPDKSTVEPGQIIFNELLPNPATGGSEYIELLNRSDKALSLKGLTLAVRKADGTLYSPCPLSSLTQALPAGGYALLSKSLEGVTAFFLASAPEALHEVKIPILNNTSATLVLLQTAGQVVIDEITYNSQWHTSGIKDYKGISLERIDPDADTQAATNWTSASSTAGGGTPGYKNSQYMTSQPTGTLTIEPPTLVEGSDYYNIAYHMDEPGYSCRAYIYTPSGQRVAQPANRTLLGTDGHLTWDGTGPDGRRLSTGIYLFYVELYHPNGKTHNYKKTFLIR